MVQSIFSAAYSISIRTNIVFKVRIANKNLQYFFSDTAFAQVNRLRGKEDVA